MVSERVRRRAARAIRMRAAIDAFVTSSRKRLHIKGLIA
ncbi:hypothetical protein BURPS305_5610 [Burkholderia pseudomallei 305]|nr:hypothetical protein BURPS305_5610 [Burkholderia pseudomallei 305]